MREREYQTRDRGFSNSKLFTLTIGIEKVRIEHNLVSTAHNLKVMWAKMTGKVAVQGKIGGLIANSASELRNFFGFRAMLNSMCH